MKGSEVSIFSVICHNLNLSVGLASCTEFNLLLLQLFHYGKQKESKNRIEIFIEQTQQNRFLQLPFSLTRHIFSFLSAYKLATGAFRVCAKQDGRLPATLKISRRNIADATVSS